MYTWNFRTREERGGGGGGGGNSCHDVSIERIERSLYKSVSKLKLEDTEMI